MIVIILCAGLCTLTCLWVLKSVRTPRAFYTLATICAILSLGIYLVLGNPNLPGHPFTADPQARADMRKEAEFMLALEKDPNDENALVRLAALRILQGRTGDDTVALLDRAYKINPKDKRIEIVRTLLIAPSAPEKTR